MEEIIKQQKKMLETMSQQTSVLKHLPDSMLTSFLDNSNLTNVPLKMQSEKSLSFFPETDLDSLSSHTDIKESKTKMLLKKEFPSKEYNNGDNIKIFGRIFYHIVWYRYYFSK